MYLWTVFAELIYNYDSFLFSCEDSSNLLKGKFMKAYHKNLEFTLNLAKNNPNDILCHYVSVVSTVY